MVIAVSNALGDMAAVLVSDREAAGDAVADPGGDALVWAVGDGLGDMAAVLVGVSER